MKLKGKVYAVLFTITVFLFSRYTSWAHLEKYEVRQMPQSMSYPMNDFSRRKGFCEYDVDGTTPHMEEIFVGRCWDYQRASRAAVSDLKDCTELWQLFLQAFVNRDPCNVTSDDYLPFNKAAVQVIGVNKILFWSGTYNLSHAYASGSNRQLTTLEDTLPGYVANMLTWCGQAAPPGINYDSCQGQCCQQAQDAYWGTLSAEFARQASGVATVMLNGSRETGTSFSNISYFGKYELPQLNPRNVTSVTIMVIHTLDVAKKESCGEGSVLRLQNLLGNRGLNNDCVDDPDAVRHLQCSENPESPDCKAWRSSVSGANRTSMMSGVLVFMITLYLTCTFSS